jgi:Sulfotransferase family
MYRQRRMLKQKLNKRHAAATFCSVLLLAVAWFELRMFRALGITNSSNGHAPSVGATARGKKSQGQVARALDRPQEQTDPPPPKITKNTSKNEKKPPPPKYSKSDFANCSVLEPGDAIHSYGDWDGAPVVVPEHKLLFFTLPKVGCTVWKQLFRRIAGYEDWLVDGHPLPHAPSRNGLTYLYDYPPAEADRMLTDPAWTRAIFVREPKERLLSAYLDKGRQNSYVQHHCCPQTRRGDPVFEKLQCDNKQPLLGPVASQKDKTPPIVSFDDFLGLVVPNCRDKHWEPQHQRVDAKYWSLINFVGHMESMAADAQRLLERVGAWDDYGSHGWPPKGQSIFQGTAVKHATDSSSRLRSYFTPLLETLVDRMVLPDYENPVLGLTRKTIAHEPKR